MRRPRSPMWRPPRCGKSCLSSQVKEKTGVPQTGDKAYQQRKKIKGLFVGQFTYNQGFNQLTKTVQEKLVTAFAAKGMQEVEGIEFAINGCKKSGSTVTCDYTLTNKEDDVAVGCFADLSHGSWFDDYL